METFFTADLHFGHHMMSKLRGFETLEEHDEFVVGQWNATIGRRDEVWFLGDLSFAPAEETERLFNSLNGRKHLVRGNHDPNRVVNLQWDTVHDMVRRRFDGVSYFMCHYPMLTWPNAHHGTRHLHGHSHNNLRNQSTTTRLDVGFDCNSLTPFSLDEVGRRFENLTYLKIDHH